MGTIIDITDESGYKTFSLNPLGVTAGLDCAKLEIPYGVTITSISVRSKQFVRYISYNLSDGTEFETGKAYNSDTRDEMVFSEGEQFVGFGIEMFKDRIAEITPVTYNSACGLQSIEDRKVELKLMAEQEAKVLENLTAEFQVATVERMAEIQAITEVELIREEEEEEEIVYIEKEAWKHLVFASGLFAILILACIIFKGLCMDKIPEEAIKELEMIRRKKNRVEEPDEYDLDADNEYDPYTHHPNVGTEAALNDDEDIGDKYV